ncbi:Transposase, Mutator family [Ferrithrix thermotolerans DSM 19514]|uniref:Mutator family transposase n=1 Tax=Ferrithrix thermotolerans DSM 19514 TaxID=1121881 RepID=A0A1M4X4S1_9ACTN|nr:Transposase, Mutator family [Ferrithrix thermotolerans DSM 19514]
MSADIDAVLGADYRHPGPERKNRRNGYRQRLWDTRVSTIELRIPKLRQGTYFPDWFLERHRRSEVALTSVIATCYVLGVSTRRLEKLAETLGITQLSKYPRSLRWPTA